MFIYDEKHHMSYHNAFYSFPIGRKVWHFLSVDMVVGGRLFKRFFLNLVEQPMESVLVTMFFLIDKDDKHIVLNQRGFEQ